MRRNAGIIVAVVVLALSGAAILAWALWQDPDRFRPQLAALLSEAAGVPVALDGPMRWSLQPTLTLQVSQVSLRAPLLSVRVERLEVRADTLGLLRGDLRLQRLFAAGVTVDLSAGHAADGSGGLPDPSQLPVDRLEIEDLRLRRNGQPLFAIERVKFDGAARSTKIPIEVTVHAALAATARLQIDGEHVRLDDLVLRTAAGELRGMLDVELTKQRPRLSARLRAGELAITPQPRADSTHRLIPRVPLDLSVLRLFDAQLELAVDTLTIGEWQLQDVLLPASLREEHLQLRATARLGAGSVTVTADVRADEQHWKSRVGVAKANAGQLLALLGLHQVHDGGVLNLQADLGADGTHTDDMLRSLRGDVSLRLSDVSIDAGAVQMAGADVLVGLMHVLSGTESEPIKLSCAVADFKVRDGMLRSRDTIGAQTALSNMLGGGVIALPSERMDLLIRPWPREGLGLSATALSGAVSLSGPLLDPQIALTDEAIWRSGATAGAAVLTGGLSLIAQGLLERARGDTPCEQAMGQQKVERGREDVAESVSQGTRSAAKSVGEGVEGVAKSVGRGADNVAKTVRKGVQGLGKSLQGLFGGGATPPLAD